MQAGPEQVVESEIVVESAENQDQYNIIIGDDTGQSNQQSSSEQRIVVYQDGHPVFMETAPNFLQAADLVLTGSDEPALTCESVPPHFYGNCCSYLLDLDKFQSPVKNVSDLVSDAYTGWRAWGTKDMFFQESGSGDFVKVGSVGKKPANSTWDLLVHEYRMFHPQRDPFNSSGDGKLTKRIYAIFSDIEYKEITGRWVLVVYEWRGQPFDMVAARKLNSRNYRPQSFANMDNVPDTSYTLGLRKAAQPPRPVPHAVPQKKRKRQARQIHIPNLEEVGEDELLELEKEKLEREIEILDMQKIYLGLKIEKEQKLFEEETGGSQANGQNGTGFPHETVQYVQVSTSN